MEGYGLLGRTLGHSWSPEIHAQLGTAPYERIELEPDEVENFVRHETWRGLNVTIPYKQTVLDYCDTRSAAAERLHAVNTLIREPNGTIRGDNTDMFGFSWLLSKFCEEHLGGITALRGRSVVVLGAGGASHAVVGALQEAGACVLVYTRTRPHVISELVHDCPPAVLLVNATPVGMYPNCPASPLDEDVLAQLPDLRGVIDVIYNPERTGLCLQAERCGLPFASGLTMLVAQAWRSSSLWQGVPLDEQLIPTIEAQLIHQTENIALIGMPGSGKSSCARQLAHLTGRELIDVDDAFLAQYGTSAAEVLTQEGEPAFRRRETELLADISRASGRIISCGGGVVVSPQNYELLHQNSLIVFLDRPLNELSSSGRPLSISQGIEQLARERLTLYRAWADVVLPCTGSARGDADEIRKLMEILSHFRG